jgi:hypothetical protein
MYRYDHDIITLWAMNNPQNPPAKSNKSLCSDRVHRGSRGSASVESGALSAASTQSTAIWRFSIASSACFVYRSM